MTNIQEKAIPFALENKDLIAQAKTGSGKTIAFSIPLIQKLQVKRFTVQSMVLCPTRELANQVAIEIKKICRHIHNVKVLTLCGGVPYKPQVASLRHKAHIIVGTPGRILKHMSEDNIELENISTLVLDEADKMLDMGFYDDILEVTKALPQNRQTMLFSATYENDIQALSSSLLKDAVFIQDDSVHSQDVINQEFYLVDESTKTSMIPSLISSNQAKSVLIFCNMKIMCDKLADDLYDLGLEMVVLHSDLEQRDRDETIVLFSNKSYSLMIATDVASRGLDIDDIDLVINYDLAKDEKVHTHRIGRTARAGANGKAVSLYTQNEEEKVEDFKEVFPDIHFCEVGDLEDDLSYDFSSEFKTLYINGGKKNKIRPTDIVGTLIAKVGLGKDDIGSIDIFPFHSYVAIKKEYLDKSLEVLNKNRLKGKYYKVYSA